MRGDANGGHGGEDGAARKKASVFGLFKAVAWSFFGVRRRADLESDIAQLNPVALIVVGVVCAAIFIGVLLVIVHFVVG